VFAYTSSVKVFLPSFQPLASLIFGVVVTERLQALFLHCGFLSPTYQPSLGVVVSFSCNDILLGYH
jgi:hypothetical protein